MMTFTASRRRLLAISLSAALGLAACGGGGDGAASWADISGSSGVQALKATDTVTGSGASADNGKTLTVHYSGYLYDQRQPNQRGSKFDSSVDRNQPFSFVLGTGQVIKGWDQGVAGMKVGGKRTLLLPAALAYGNSGAGQSIPPGAALIFDVELLDAR